jgi:putative Mn2+ efflux pump MntP
MPTRIAATMSLLAFACCLVIGTFSAENPFATAVTRALVAMAGTFVVGLIVGVIAQKMLDENLASQSKNADFNEAKSPAGDR